MKRIGRLDLVSTWQKRVGLWILAFVLILLTNPGVPQTIGTEELTLEEIVTFIRDHDGMILYGPPFSSGGDDRVLPLAFGKTISLVFLSHSSTVWQVDPESGDINDMGELQLNRNTSHIVFAFGQVAPVTWTPDDLLAWLQAASPTWIIHPVFDALSVEGKDLSIPFAGEDQTTVQLLEGHRVNNTDGDMIGTWRFEGGDVIVVIDEQLHRLDWIDLF